VHSQQPAASQQAGIVASSSRGRRGEGGALQPEGADMQLSTSPPSGYNATSPPQLLPSPYS
jgi:hypothetical protein